MPFRYTLILFFSLVELGMFSENVKVDVKCGEDKDIVPKCDDHFTCNSNHTIRSVELKKKEMTLLKINDLKDVNQHCSEDEKICFNFENNRRQIRLVLKKTTFEDEGKYNLFVDRTDGKKDVTSINVNVIGEACKPEISSSQDKITCDLTVRNPQNLTIIWMDKDRKIHQTEIVDKLTEGAVKLQNSLKLAERTRDMQMSCCASYRRDGVQGEIQNCTTADVMKLESVHGSNEGPPTKQTIIPILCVLFIGISFALYILYRRRNSIYCQNRDRSNSGQQLLCNLQEENGQSTRSTPIRGHQV
ncbi:uncharacterized protein [Pyxicephalus adspersus]|uniref:uncharacterized protein n=1 Tax=Pyxicephalus adspersus TaxID=30357 RepID=UPI003B59DA3B